MSLYTCFPCVRSEQATRKKVTRTPGDSRPPPSVEACGSIRELASDAQVSTSSARTSDGEIL